VIANTLAQDSFYGRNTRKSGAKHRGIPQKSSKPGVIDAKGVFDMDLRPLTTQKESRLLQFSNQ